MERENELTPSKADTVGSETEGKPGTKVTAWTAFLLDDLIPIPGTDRRVGLDPLIGLIPGAGDFVASTVGLGLVFSGIRKGIPKSVYLRMISNWTLNALIGAVPVLGDVFSFWFKSNRRNQELIEAHLDDESAAEKRRQGWWPFLILAGAVAAVFAGLAGLIWLSARALAG